MKHFTHLAMVLCMTLCGARNKSNATNIVELPDTVITTIPNGTVKQVPVMPDSTPMVMDVTYLHDTGGVIGGMINHLASLEARIAALEGG